MSTVKEPLHPLRTARYLWLGILLCALVGGACFLGGRWSAGRSETAKIDTVVLQNQLSEIRELATVTYAYTNMAQFESSNDFYGVKIPFTTKSFILTYDGTVKAGVDLDGAEVSVSGTTVTITLPEAEILSHEIDEDSMEVFDEKTSIFNPFTVEDFTSFQSDQKAAMEGKALSRGLLAEARAKAVSSVEQLFAAGHIHRHGPRKNRGGAAAPPLLMPGYSLPGPPACPPDGPPRRPPAPAGSEIPR